jgi:hypothetical protein
MSKTSKKALICILAVLFVDGCVYQAMISGMLGENIRQVKVNLRDKKYIEENSNRVYYQSQSESLAQYSLGILIQQRKMLTDRLGLDSDKFGVVIIQKEPRTRYVVEPPSGWTIFPVELNDVRVLSHAGEFQDLYSTMMHERTEGAITRALMRKKGLYPYNRETRWIGDGLAELLGFRFSDKHSPIAALQDLQNKLKVIEDCRNIWHISKYNLKDFKAISGSIKEAKKGISMLRNYPAISSARYGMSLYYWASIEQELGAQAVKEIVSKLEELQEPTNENIEKVIGDVADQKYVERIEDLSADEALEFFTVSISCLIPRVREELASDERPTRMAAYETLHSLDAETFNIDLSDIATTAKIADIVPDSPAYIAGLRWGDIMERINGNPVESFEEFTDDFSQLNEREIEVKVLREGAEQILTVESFAGCKFQPIAR